MRTCFRTRLIIAFTAALCILAAGAGAEPRTIPLQEAGTGAAPALQLVAHEPGGCRVEVRIPAIEIEDRDLGGQVLQVLTVPGGALSGVPGEPGLPTVGGLLAVPRGAQVRATARVVAEKTLAGVTLAPLAVEEADAALPRAKARPAGDDAPLVTVGEPAIIHGQRVVPFTVYPVRHDPERGEVTVASAVDLEFTYEGSGGVSERPYVAESFDRLFAQTVTGWDELREDVTVGPGTWLAICPNNASVVTAMEPLRQWRERQGYHTILVTTQQAGGTANAIKNYIQGVYDTVQPPLEFICLVGDAGGTIPLPTWYENVSWYGGEGDHYYTTLEGGDQLADVHVGRLTTRSVTELQGIVTKILGYETAPPTFEDPGWFTRASLTGDPSASGITTIYVNQWVKAQIERLGYTQVDTIFSSPFASRMFSTCDAGVSVFTYRGYLGVSGFSTGYIDNLENGLELPFAVIPTCASGSFAGSSHTYSEAFLRNPDGGAIGSIGTATTGTHTRYNNCYFNGVWQGILNEGDRHLGYAHTRGKLELFRQYAVAEPDIPEIWSVWNNLMGDPASEMWQALPLGLTVTHPAHLPTGAGAVPITVTSQYGPVVGARVAAAKPGEVRSVGYTDQSGRVTLPLAGVSLGSLLVTVTGPDLMPYEGAITLGAVSSFATVDSYVLDDSVGGDGDGQPNPAETVDLQVSLRNLGVQLAGSVNATLVSESEFLRVLVPTVAFGDIPGGAVVAGGPFTVEIIDNAPDGLEGALRLTATSGGDTWVSQIVLPIVAADPVVTEVLWNGWPGNPQPGQTGELTVTLQNQGARNLSGAMARLSVQSPYILLAGPAEVTLGALPVSATVQAVFPVTVRSDCFGGHLAALEVEVEADEGSRHMAEFTVAIGSGSLDSPTGPDSYGYLAFDDQDPHPDAPVFSWVEIDPNLGGDGEDVGLTDFSYEGDDTRPVALPFTFRYFGEDFSTISICSNGWAALGETTLKHYRNWSLPCAGSPNPLLAVFWDDLRQSGTNRVYHWYDAVNHRYIIQWARMRNGANGLTNCEVILHDPEHHPTLTGDGLIVYQYQAVTNNDTSRGYATVGIQNLDSSDGITWTYYNQYAPGARTLAPGRAIAWVPAQPLAANQVTVTPNDLAFALLAGEQETRTLVLGAFGDAGSVLSFAITRDLGPGAPASAGAGQADPESQTLDVPQVTVLVPNGGETWYLGESRDITWNATDGVANVRIDLDRDDGNGWVNLTGSVAAALGSWAWTVEGDLSDQCRVRVRDISDVIVQDTSDGTFSIAPNLNWLTVSPDAGYLPAGQTQEIQVTVNAAGLADGIHWVSVIVNHNAGEPVVVPIQVLVGEVTAAPEVPLALDLAPVHPNPFNPRTEIAFSLPRDQMVQLSVHDLTGRRVRSLVATTLPAGTHHVTFEGAGEDGRRLASGTYLLRLVTGGEVLTQKMLLVK